MNKILVNSRSFKYINGINNQIIKALSYNSEGIQVSILDYNDLINLKINNIIKRKIKDKYVVFHAPTNIEYDNSKLSSLILNKIKNVCLDLKCYYIIFHYNNIKNVKMINNILDGFNLSVENLNSITENNSLKDLNNFLVNNNNFTLTLDFCHAIEHSKNYLTNLIKLLSNKVRVIHWSINKDINHTHYSPSLLYNEKRKDIDFMINKLKTLDKPIVLEIKSDYVKKDNKIINNEIEFLKKKLKRFK